MNLLAKRRWTIVGILTSMLLLVWVFWRVDFAQLKSLVLRSNVRLVVAVGVLNFVVIVLKAARWGEILAATQRIPLGATTLATLVGYMANSLLPARAGEVVRVFVLGSRRGLSKSMVLATLALDHLLEGVAMALLMLGLPFLLVTPVWMRSATIALGGLLVVALGAVMVAAYFPGRLGTRSLLPTRWQAWIESHWARFRLGLETVRNPRRAVGVVLLACATWVVQAVMVYLSLRATGLQCNLREALFVLLAINLGTMIPGAPSSVGPFEFAAIVSLGFLGVEKTPALSFALLYHFVQVIPTIVAGWLALPFVGLTMAGLRRSNQSLPS
jgi:uncharacterized protein (TIRG00374 family)